MDAALMHAVPSCDALMDAAPVGAALVDITLAGAASSCDALMDEAPVSNALAGATLLGNALSGDAPACAMQAQGKALQEPL